MNQDMNRPLMPKNSTEQVIDKDGNQDLKDYILQRRKVLGKGSYATVFQGYRKDCSEVKLAIKEIKIINRIDDTKFLDNLDREIKILQKLEHVNIIKLYDVLYYTENVYIILEICKQGDFKQMIDEKQIFQENEIKIFLVQLVRAFMEMYKNNVIHRDLKPANILLVNKNLIKLTDFGFAREISNIDTPSHLTRVGSPLYMSPQILKGNAFSSKCDVWSLGVIMYQMLYGKTPWMANTPKQLLQNIEKNKNPKFVEAIVISQELKHIIKQMLMFDEEDRISWEELWNTQYIQTLDQDQNLKEILLKSLRQPQVEPKKKCLCF